MLKDTPTNKPTAERGQFALKPTHYGQSRLGAPLLCWLPEPEKFNGLLVMAGTHGDENDAVVALSCALRTIQEKQLTAAVILSVNPDGCQLGTRANAQGVDLNRNLPTKNWQSDNVVYRWSSNTPERDVKLSTGDSPGSEPETQALLNLIHELNPKQIVSLHGPLGWVEDPCNSELGQWLSQHMSLPLVTETGYPTPGSFGTWCDEQALPVITAELPNCSISDAIEQYSPVLANLLIGQHPSLVEKS